ncbi:MAG: ABC transporter ATP-binding protein [Ignavibacteria bacterium]|nr:ABC transporter ATP-binding protein [Ignavibacteria bacterium]
MKSQPVFELDDIAVYFEKHAVSQRSLRHMLGTLTGRNGQEYFHALRDIRLTIGPGEHIGLIGRNGAGKSTLLRVLSRVITPREGHVYVRPDLHIVPLLELGIGFQPDLTGRENCFLAGLLMGYSESQIEARIDGIRTFSELGEYFDEPVKNYSSGMYARLAFALATDVEPEVLLIDEVFGVGDEFFMRKCVIRMQRLMESGRTTVLVSHNLDFLVMHCDRLIWLDQGRMMMDGEPAKVAAEYRGSGGQ